MRRYYRLFAGLLLFSLLVPSRALALSFPTPTGYVNDFANILPGETKTSLEAKLTSLEKDTGIEFSVVTVESLEGTTVDDYAVRLFENWKIGKKGKNNGLLLLVAPNDRKVKFEVGYGLEPVLSDAASGRILDRSVLPSFKVGDYPGGIENGVNDAISVIAGKESSPAAAGKSSGPSDFLDNLGPLIILPLVLLQYLASFLARSKSFWAGGAIGGVIGIIIGLVTKSFWTGFGSVILLGPLGLLLDFILSKNYDHLKKLGRPTTFWGSGGGFFKGGSGGSSFGGFGGGFSGGGGSSRSW